MQAFYDIATTNINDKCMTIVLAMCMARNVWKYTLMREWHVYIYANLPALQVFLFLLA